MRRRIQCPSCAAKGEDRSKDNLAVYPDEKGGYCQKCQKYHKLEGGEVVETVANPKYSGGNRSSDLSLSMIQTYPIRAIPEWGISEEVCQKYGYRCSVDESTGEPDAHYCPSFNDDGQITGYKKRRLPKEFSVVGKLSGLIGRQACKGGKFLLIVEGEKDMLAASEMLRRSGKDYNVVSLPNGANEQGTVDSATLRDLDFMVKHERVVVCLDSDKPGQATAKAIAELLASQTEVCLLKLPYKDAAVVLEKGKHERFLKELFNAKPYRPEEIVEGANIDIQSLRTAKQPGVELPYPKLQKMTWGLRKGEITLITAGTGIGKSSLVREIGYHLATMPAGYVTANIALETMMEDAARYYVAMDNNVPAYKLMFNPKCIPEQAYQESYDKLFGSNRLHFFKHWGSLASDDLIRKCNYFVKALKADFIILDHISMVVAGQESRDERKDIDALFEGLTRLVTETGVGVIAVMHLKRVQGKSFNKGAEVELTDLRGSAGAEQMSFNVWALERDQQGEQKDIVKVRVLKNRLLGFTGECDLLRYDHETGRLLVLDTEY